MLGEAVRIRPSRHWMFFKRYIQKNTAPLVLLQGRKAHLRSLFPA